MHKYKYRIEGLQRFALSKTRFNSYRRFLQGTLELTEEPKVGELVKIPLLYTSLKLLNIEHESGQPATLILDGSDLR